MIRHFESGPKILSKRLGSPQNRLKFFSKMFLKAVFSRNVSPRNLDVSAPLRLAGFDAN
jgi:hypothetical protein